MVCFSNVGGGGTALSKLNAAIREFQAADDRDLDLKGLRTLIDSLEFTFSADMRRSQQSGAHFADGSATVVNWAGRLCGMSATSVADRLCVGTQLQSLPRIAEARAALPPPRAAR